MEDPMLCGATRIPAQNKAWPASLLAKGCCACTTNIMKNTSKHKSRNGRIPRLIYFDVLHTNTLANWSLIP